MSSVNSNTTIDRLIADVVTKYKSLTTSVDPKSMIELELRFGNIDTGVFKNIYEVISHSKEFAFESFEYSINVISHNIYERKSKAPNDTSYIRKMRFDKTIKTSDEYLTKVRLARPVVINDKLRYTIILSRESIIGKFPTTSDSFIRYKLRASFMHGPWRFDITSVAQFPYKELSEDNRIVTIKDQLFATAPSIENFALLGDSSYINQREIEIEYVPNGNVAHVLSAKDLAISKVIIDMISPEFLSTANYQNEIYSVAKYIIDNRRILHLFKDKYRLKQLANQVVTLSKSLYYADIYPPKGYIVTDKADGMRCIINARGSKCVIISDQLYEFVVDGVDNDVTIVDAELIIAPNSISVYIFDCMVVNGENISHISLMERVKRISECAEILSKYIRSPNICKAKRMHRLGRKMETYGGEAPVTNTVILEKNVDIATGVFSWADSIDDDSSDYAANDSNDSNDILGSFDFNEEFAAQFKEIYEGEYPYEIDGIIISEPNKPYHQTTNYKWKPFNHTTIDFLAVKCPSSMLGVIPYMKKKGYDLYLLFVGVSSKMQGKLGLGLIHNYKELFPAVDSEYYPIQFSPSCDPYAYLYYHDSSNTIDRKIVELRRDDSSSGGGYDQLLLPPEFISGGFEIGKWIFVRIREDRKLERRYFGNDFKVAELTYLNYIDKFLLEDLSRPPSGYFTKIASAMYVAANRFKRFVISILIKNNLSGAKWILDEASGRGADLHRYQEVGVYNAMFIDIDRTAISELIRRKFDMFNMKRRRMQQWTAPTTTSIAQSRVVSKYDKIHGNESKHIVATEHAMTIHALVADLKTNADVLIKDIVDQFPINAGLMDGIVCNFALHYMCDKIENMRNVLEFNSKMMKVGGIFLFTTLNGRKVFDILKDTAEGDSWQDTDAEPGEPASSYKYVIKKLYSGKVFAPAGQLISVKLPFTDEMITEPLSNIEVIVAEAKKFGLSVELNESFSGYLDKFAVADNKLYVQLGNADKRYIALHQFVSLRKVK